MKPLHKFHAKQVVIGQASSSGVAGRPNADQSQAVKRPASSTDPVNISGTSNSPVGTADIDSDIDMSEIGSIDLTRFDGIDGNFSDLSLISTSSSNYGTGLDPDCVCDKLQCLARRCVSKPKR